MLISLRLSEKSKLLTSLLLLLLMLMHACHSAKVATVISAVTPSLDDQRHSCGRLSHYNATIKANQFTTLKNVLRVIFSVSDLHSSSGQRKPTDICSLGWDSCWCRVLSPLYTLSVPSGCMALRHIPCVGWSVSHCLHPLAFRLIPSQS